jgi:hypothetical protein
VHYPSYPRKLKKPLKTEEIHHRGTEDTKDAVTPEAPSMRGSDDHLTVKRVSDAPPPRNNFTTRSRRNLWAWVGTTYKFLPVTDSPAPHAWKPEG